MELAGGETRHASVLIDHSERVAGADEDSYCLLSFTWLLSPHLADSHLLSGLRDLTQSHNPSHSHGERSVVRICHIYLTIYALDHFMIVLLFVVLIYGAHGEETNDKSERGEARRGLVWKINICFSSERV